MYIQSLGALRRKRSHQTHRFFARTVSFARGKGVLAIGNGYDPAGKPLFHSAERPPLGEAVWKDTALLPASASFSSIMKNCFTEETMGRKDKLYLADALAKFPVCLLEAGNE